METSVDQHPNLELDPLLDWKPVELVSDVVWDRVELPFPHDQASSYTQWSQVNSIAWLYRRAQPKIVFITLHHITSQLMQSYLLESYLWCGDNKSKLDEYFNFYYNLIWNTFMTWQVEICSRCSDKDWSFAGPRLSAQIRGWDGVWSAPQHQRQHPTRSRSGQ